VYSMRDLLNMAENFLHSHDESKKCILCALTQTVCDFKEENNFHDPNLSFCELYGLKNYVIRKIFYIVPFDVDARILARHIYWVTRAVEHIAMVPVNYKGANCNVHYSKNIQSFDPVSILQQYEEAPLTPSIPPPRVYKRRKSRLHCCMLRELSMHFALYRPVRCPHSLLPSVTM
jgi:hypothetical protein